MSKTDNCENIATLSELYDRAVCLLTNEINTNNRVTVDILRNLLKKYVGKDWEEHVNKSVNLECKYNKKLVYGSELLDLYVITWLPKSTSKIHDHPENGCIVKILEGFLEEDVYLNDGDKVKFITTNNLSLTEDLNMGFRKGNEVLHRIKNNSNNFSISLHFYCCGGYKLNVYD